MNHVYRVVWNSALNVWQAVGESAAARRAGRTPSARSLRRSGHRLHTLAAIAGLAGAGLVALPAAAQSSGTAVLPSGAKVVAGQASISQQGNVLTVNQGSARLATDWASFSIGAGQTVNFVQPSSSAVALNRVTGADPSVIQGALRANGQVFLLNPNGVLFAPGAQVDVGGLLASTLKMSTDDFIAGRYTLSGDSSASVENQGRISAANGGTVALVAARIVNTGRIEADAGQVLMGAGNKVTLDLGGPVKIQVDQGAVDALIEQGGAIRADGGLVYLTAKAANALTHAAINHTGVTEARTLASGQTGTIVLLGDMNFGSVNAGGTLDASAPQGGAGGFVETSAAHVALQPGLQVNTQSSAGATGTWLIDPNDFTIAASGGNITGAALTTALASSNVSIATATQGTAGGNGDIFVNDNVGWSAHTLTLTAERNIAVNANLTATGTGALAFQYGQGTTDGSNGTYTVASNAQIVIPAATAFTWKKGASGSTKNLVLDNGNLRLGDGAQASFTSDGQAAMPYYFDNTTTGRNGWYQLTLGYPLDVAYGAGGVGTSSWNYNGEVLSTDWSSTLPAHLSNKSFDISRYKEGIGTIVSSSTVTFSSGQAMRVDNAYTLSAGTNYLAIDTALTNLSTSTLANLRYWTGTRDDYVGYADVSTKTKGNIVNGSFVPLTTANSASNALKVNEYTNNTGAAVLFYSTTAGVDMTHDSCCSFSYSTNKDPRSSAISAYTDGSYALFMRFADLAPGQTGRLDWFYAAAPAAQLVSAVTQVAQQSGSITSTPVYLRANSGSSVYGNTPGVSYSLYDASSGGNLVTNASPTGSVLFSGAPTATSSVGLYSLTYASGIVLGNGSYTLSAGAAGTWTVTPRPLNLAVTKVYDGSANVAAGFALSGTVNGDATPAVSGAATLAGRDVGSYNGLASSSLALSNSNYTLVGGTVTAAVTPRPITVSADAKTKTYGDADAALSYTVTNGSLVAGDSLSGALTRVVGENVGSYMINASQLANGNYTITANNGTLSITPRPITVTADAKSKVYGNADPTLSYQVSSGNLVGNDTLSGALTRAAGESVGSYTIDASPLTNGNYAITASNGALSISPRPITVAVDSKNKGYGSADPALTYRVTNGSAVTGDSLDIALTRVPGESIGLYAIDAQALANGNYLVNANNGVLTIGPSMNSLAITGNTASATTTVAMAPSSALPASGNKGLTLVDAESVPREPGGAGASPGGQRLLVVQGGIRLESSVEGVTR